MSDVTTDVQLTLEQIRGMTPDYVTLRSADELARGGVWGDSGWSRREEPMDGRLLWAEFPDNRRGGLRATSSLPDMRLTCTCNATRFPCRHTLALLLRDGQHQLPYGDAPGWATRLDGTNRGGQGDALPLDPAAEVQRRAVLAAGMADLGLWLGDLTRQGLASLPKRNRRFWLDAADRLVDAYAFEAARELRALSLIPGSGADWPERLLPRLGRLALLCAAFRRLDDLSPGERGDALAAAGRPPRPGYDRVSDRWLVLGRRQEIEGKGRRERIWLWGVASGRWALLADARPAGRAAGVCLPTGATAAGELAYLPSAFPLTAKAIERLYLTDDLPQSPNLPISNLPIPNLPLTDIDAAIATYAAALAANPWLRLYPVALRDVFIEPPGFSRGGWRARDRGGRLLPLPERFAHGWHLLSLAADRPLSLFGEFDGAVFTPLSLLDGRVRALAAWRGLP